MVCQVPAPGTQLATLAMPKPETLAMPSHARVLESLFSIGENKNKNKNKRKQTIDSVFVLQFKKMRQT